jgi:hypothetical protein
MCVLRVMTFLLCHDVVRRCGHSPCSGVLVALRAVRLSLSAWYPARSPETEARRFGGRAPPGGLASVSVLRLFKRFEASRGIRLVARATRSEPFSGLAARARTLARLSRTCPFAGLLDRSTVTETGGKRARACGRVSLPSLDFTGTARGTESAGHGWARALSRSALSPYTLPPRLAAASAYQAEHDGTQAGNTAERAYAARYMPLCAAVRLVQVTLELGLTPRVVSMS